MLARTMESRRSQRTLGGTASTRRARCARTLLTVEALELRSMPAPLTWAPGITLPTSAGGSAVVPENTGLLVLAGPTTTSYNLSVANPTWKASATPTVQPLDFARLSPGVGPLPNGDVLVYGGTQNGYATSAVTQYDPNTVTVVDGTTNSTRTLRSMNTPRTSMGTATDQNDNSYAIGGQDNNGTPLSSVEVYNPSTNAWSYVASLPQTLYGESAVSDGAGHLYTLGGVGPGGAITSNVYCYTIATNAWSQVVSLPTGVTNSAAVLGPNGSIYVMGGVTASGTTAAVESYSPSSNTWTTQGPLPQPVSGASAAVDSLGRIEVIGGYDASGNSLAATWISQELTQPDLAPTITTTATTSAIVNMPYTYQVLSTANPQSTYTLTSAPAGMTINASTGLISWTPTVLGSTSVTVQASNSAGQTAQTFPLNVVLPTPPAPTGLTGVGRSTTAIELSWNSSPDPNVTSYDLYRGYAYHSPKGSGGGINWVLFASGITSTSVTISGSGISGNYLVTAVNSEGVQSPRSAPVSAAVLSAPDLWGAMTTTGADIASMSLSVGQTGQLDLLAYGSAPLTYSVVSGPSGVSVNQTTGLVTYTPSVTDIGTQVVTFAATNAVGRSTNTFTFFVSALSPTVTVASPTVTYDGNPHGVTASALGTDGVTPVNGSFTFTYNGSTAPPTAAGTYAVVATFTSADPAYASAVVNTTLTINPATPVLTVTGGSIAYDGNPHAATATAVGIDGVTPVNGTFQLTYNGDTNPPTDPGLYTVNAAFASNDSNYTSMTTTANLIIESPGTLTPNLSLADGSAPYDGTAHADTPSALASDNVTPVAGAFLVTYNGSTTVPTQAGSYTVVATFISSDPQYADATISGTMTISQATPTVSVDPNPFVYNGTSQAALVSALGVDGSTPVDGTFIVTYDGSSTPPVDAGTYNVDVQFTSNDPNYASTEITSTITILPATASVGITGDWIFTYNGSPQSVVGIATGIDGVTPIAGNFTYTYYDQYYPWTQLAGAPVDAGSYSFTETFTSLDPNYSGGTFSWDLDINPAYATVSISGGPYTYSGSPQPVSVSDVGIDGVTPVAGTVFVTYNGSTTVPSLPGTYAVVASLASSDPDYYGGSATGTLVITRATPAFNNLASPTVTTSATSVTVSGHIAAGSAVPNGDAVAVTLNGITQSAIVSGGGSFSTSFNIQGLPTGTYPITYAFLGDATRFNAAGSGSGTLTIQTAPNIVTSPVSQTVVAGTAVTFSASATGFPAPTVQWQVSTNGTNYSNISGATSSTYTISATTVSQNNDQFRAVFTNSVGSTTTTAATLSIQAAPTVTTNPTSRTINAGQSTTFTAAATGSPSPTVQWQVSTNGGSSFTNISGATSTTLSVSTTTASQNGSVYRALFTNSVGSVTTATATLTVHYAPVLTTSPTSLTVNAGQSASFTASSSGNPAPTVRWQVSTNGGSSFSNISGATSLTYAISAATASQNGYEYRAVFTNSLGSVTTAAATLTVLFAPTVTTNPTSQSVTAGSAVSFVVVATGNPTPTVQWQVSTDGGLTYNNIAGATGTTLTLSTTTTAENGYRYRAVLTNSLGSATSGAATLSVH